MPTIKETKEQAKELQKHLKEVRSILSKNKHFRMDASQTLNEIFKDHAEETLGNRFGETTFRRATSLDYALKTGDHTEIAATVSHNVVEIITGTPPSGITFFERMIDSSKFYTHVDQKSFSEVETFFGFHYPTGQGSKDRNRLSVIRRTNGLLKEVSKENKWARFLKIIVILDDDFSDWNEDRIKKACNPPKKRKPK